MSQLTHANAQAVIYTNEQGVRVIARPCTECAKPMVPSIKSTSLDLCKWCHTKIWGN